MSRPGWRGVALVIGVTGLGLAGIAPNGLPVPGLEAVVESRALLWGGLLCLGLAVWGRGG